MGGSHVCPGCPMHGSGGSHDHGNQQSPATTWGPPIPDVPSFQVVDQPPAPSPVRRLPLVPVERGDPGPPAIDADKLNELRELVKAALPDVAGNTAKIEEINRQLESLTTQIGEHSHETLEPTSDEIYDMAVKVIAILPPFRFQAKTPGPDGKPTGPIIKKYWTMDGSDILYFQHDTEIVEISTDTLTLIPVE